METHDLFDTDWNALLESGDTLKVKDGGNDEIEVVPLVTLQKFARMAGICSQELKLLTPSDSMVQAIFSCSFKLSGGQEVRFVGAADCNARNTKGKFIDYPTAVAESRAEARCLRKALGIKMLSSEEIGFRDTLSSIEASPKAKADAQIIVAIEKLCVSRGVELLQVIEKVVDKSRASSIYELSQLTSAEAQKALVWLNDRTIVKPSAAEQRAARKAELESKVKE